MAILVKICGINSAVAADAAARAGADMVGLALIETSPRHLRLDQASALASRLRGKTKLVVLLSNPTDEELTAAVAAIKPDYLQLHGIESPSRTAAIRARHDVAIIKPIGVAVASDLRSASSHEAHVDMFLFDAKPPQGATREGGHGAAFDWKVMRGHPFARPWLLAGGLSADNVARAIESSGAPGVDVSSGVETAPGQKSVELITQFVASARGGQFAKEARS